MKDRGEKIAMITCYDSTFAKIVNNTSIDIILVGDSLGNTMMGYDSTLPVTLDDMLRYTSAVVRANQNQFIIADMPYMSYQNTVAEAVENAGRLIKETGCGAIKLEGGSEFAEVIQAITRAQIPVVGHLGLTPQSFNAFGGYTVQGKTTPAVEKLLADALAVQNAGARMLVVEGVPAVVGDLIASKLQIPVIGIGAGQCDGQVLVLQDMLGMNEAVPKFVKKYAQLQNTISDALQDYSSEVKGSAFPTAEFGYTLDEKQIDEIGRLY